MAAPDPPVVLVVDDEPDLADLYTRWLTAEYTVNTAYSGEGALDALDASVDVLLLDRRMPDLSGDAVLSTIRERDLDCRVVLVTAVEPDIEILELGFDEYLTKPVTSADLHEAIETMLTRKHHDVAIQEYYRLVSARATLHAHMGAEVADHPKYEALQAEIRAQEEELDDLVADLDDADLEAQFHRLAEPPEPAPTDTEANQETH